MESVSRTNQMMLIQEIDLGGRQVPTWATFIGNWGHFFQLGPLLGRLVDYDYEKKKITSKQAKFEHVFHKSLLHVTNPTENHYLKLKSIGSKHLVIDNLIY